MVTKKATPVRSTRSNSKASAATTLPVSMAAGEFKSKCLSVMDRIAAEGSELVITKRGKPVAKVVPIKRESAFGFLKDKIQIIGDIDSPVTEEWEIELD